MIAIRSPTDTPRPDTSGSDLPGVSRIGGAGIDMSANLPNWTRINDTSPRANGKRVGLRVPHPVVGTNTDTRLL